MMMEANMSAGYGAVNTKMDLINKKMTLGLTLLEIIILNNKCVQ